MDDLQEHSVDSARDAATRGELDEWVTSFLASPGSDNADLADKLAATTHCWTGPVELPLDQLNRLAGAPGTPALAIVEEDEWRDDVEDLARKVEGGFEPPPVIATYEDGQLLLEDGNHRAEALRRAGRTTTWGIVGFADSADRDAFEPPTA